MDFHFVRNHLSLLIFLPFTDGRSTPEPREEISPEVDVDALADWPTKEEHEASLLHQETHSHFLMYGVMLMEEVYPLLAGMTFVLILYVV